MEAVRDWLSRTLARLRALWTEASKKTRILIISAIAGAVLLLAALIVWLTHTNYVLLASGLSTQEYANVMSLLGEIGVEPQITNTGAILVPEADINRAKMQLVQRMSGSAGYDLWQSLGITATQADKNQVAIYQNQERLRAMIESYDEIDHAEVQFSIPQPSIYRLQSEELPKTAVIQITKRAGRTLSPEQIQGIINAVRFSESGLLEENIAISDETGDLKIQLQSGISTSKLNLSEQVNASVRNRLLQGLQPVYGADNIQIAVNAILNTDQVTQRKTEYFPFDETNPQNNPLDLRERDYEQIGEGDPAAEGVPGTNDNADIPQYSAEDIDVTGGDSWRMHDIYDYLVSSVVSDIIKEGLEITDMTVAVLINNANLPDTERDQVVDWISGATGLAATNIKVQGMRFQDVPAIQETGIDLQRILLFTGIGLLALCVIFVMIFMNIQKRNKERLAAAAADGSDMTLLDLLHEEQEYEPIQLVETQEQKLKLQIRELAQSDPEIVAQLIKTWLVNS